MSEQNRVELKLPGRVCIFAKTPELGKVKTRLEPEIGRETCLELHKWLVEDRLKAFAPGSVGLSNGDAASETNTSSYDVALYVTDNLDDDYWAKLNSNYSIPLYLQQGSTLGDRMWHAVESTLNEREWVILIGADCPDLDTEYLQAAISKMEEGAQAVIGPAEDGGYVLLGLTQPVSKVFQGIDWGTELVFRQTTHALEALELSYSHLTPLKDLDVFDDYLFYSRKIKTLPKK